MFVFLFMLLSTTVASSSSPRLPLCSKTYTIAYHHRPPYTDSSDSTNSTNHTTTTGLLFDVFKTGIEKCCTKIHQHPIQFEKIQPFAKIPENKTHSVDFILPIQRTGNIRHFLGHPFIAVVSSPGLAFFLRPAGNSLALLLGALRPVVPLLAVSVLSVGIMGVLFWMTESTALVIDGRPPQRFTPGVWEGR